MGFKTRLTELLGIEHPIIQAPMAGGSDSPALAAAVSEAGGIGFVGAQYMPIDGIATAAETIRARTNRGFGVNLFAPQPAPPAMDPGPAIDRVSPFFEELGLDRPGAPADKGIGDFEARLDALIETGARALSVTMGLLPADAIERIKARGLLLIGTATTVEEAVAQERAGADAIVAQGAEAGGHRGTFAGRDVTTALIGTMALVPQVADAVSVPVIASGGIMDGRGIAAALALGADGVQMGTAFLVTEEAGAPPPHKRALMEATEDRTRVTRAFSGRAARGVVNRFMETVEPDGFADAGGPILSFPLQNDMTRTMRAAAARAGDAGLMSLWAGQGLRMTRALPAADLMAALVAETDAALRRLPR